MIYIKYSSEQQNVTLCYTRLILPYKNLIPRRGVHGLIQHDLGRQAVRFKQVPGRNLLRVTVPELLDVHLKHTPNDSIMIMKWCLRSS